MPITGVVPEWLLSIVAVATLFTIMFDLGLAIEPGEFRWVAQRPGLMLKSLFAVLVAVPALAWLVARAFELPHAAEIGIVLMAISPGAPVALRRSLGAGGHRSFAPALQIAVTVLAVVSMPLWVAALDEYYGATATAAPQHLARQVFVAQLLPLGVGMLVRRFAAGPAAWLEPKLRRLGGILLVVLLVLALIDIWQVVVGAGLRVSLAIVIATTCALGAGHLLGGPDPATRTAVAISCAARNPGLALLVATLNAAPPAITAAVLAYFAVAAFTLIPYVAWRRRAADRRPPAREAGGLQ
jgi:BASS family bile acid:Na+ symporter